MKKYTISQFRADYPTDDACLDKIFQIRYTNLVCPKCESDNKFNKVKDRRSYQCPSCSFQVYPTKDTIFEKTTTPLTYWFLAIFMQCTTRNGVAAKELERTLNVCYKTALRMAHQIKKLMADRCPDPFYGFCEADESFLGGKFANYKNKKREELKKTYFKSPMFGKTTIFGILQRDGRVFTQVIPSPSRQYVEPIIKSKIVPNSKLCTDSSNIYNEIGKDYVHDTVNHQDKEWARGKWHTNTIESFWNQVKRTIKGTHIHVSEQHLQKYLDEVAFRWEHRNQQDTMFETILQKIV